MSTLQSVLRRFRDRWPVQGFHFDRPLVLFQSDDWGRVGLRDREGFEQLQNSGITLGERPYDFYSLETADDLSALGETLKQHRDSSGHHPCIGMNFIMANLDFARMYERGSDSLPLLFLAEGLPHGWSRPGLMEAYRVGIAEGIFIPALHGTTHFCRPAVERNAGADSERAHLLRTMWKAGTPYIHWRMPWIGYEYWDPERDPNKRFLSAKEQQELVGEGVGAFAKVFSNLPHSACAPGYRANSDTHRIWAQHGIRVAQNGPATMLPPHFDRNELLHLSRTVEFEPAVDPAFSVASSLEQAEHAFSRGVPAIVSMHSINFHSTIRDFRSTSLQFLSEFLTALERRQPDLLYLNDEDLYQLIVQGSCAGAGQKLPVNVWQKKFMRAAQTRV
jgi:hypothetical protein